MVFSVVIGSLLLLLFLLLSSPSSRLLLQMLWLMLLINAFACPPPSRARPHGVKDISIVRPSFAGFVPPLALSLSLPLCLL